MRILLLLLLAPLAAYAQTPAAAPAATTPTPNICNQSVSGFAETEDGNRIGLSGGTVFALPWADVKANHDEQVKLLGVISKEQNKGGPYTVTITEVQDCDGAGNVRIPTGSIYVEGVTLESLTGKIFDASIDAQTAINKRYKDRAAAQKGNAKAVGWNHKNAKAFKRNDRGQVVSDQ